MIDLHTHSTASDGTMSPEELVKYADRCGVHTLALTDHDTVAGIDDAMRAGRRYGVTVIPGIEFQVEVPDEDAISGTCHILGLALDEWDSGFSDRLCDMVGMREERNRRIVSRMKNAGISVEYDDIVAYAGEGVVGRPHIARYMVDRRLAESELHAFQEYLGESGEFYVPREVPTLSEAIALIHSAGGKAMLAHPYTLFVSWNGLTERLVHWRRLGLDGVEAFHSNMRYSEGVRISEMAKEIEMIVSAGSDFHGLQRKDRRLGRTADGHKIDDSFALPFVPDRVG